MNLEPTVHDLLQRRIGELGRRDFGWIAEAIEVERGGVNLKVRLFAQIRRMGSSSGQSDEELRKLLIARQHVVGSLLTLECIADTYGTRELRLTVAMRILREIGSETEIIALSTAQRHDAGELIARLISLRPGGRWCASVESHVVGPPKRIGVWHQPFVGKRGPLTQGPLVQTAPFWVPHAR